MILKNNIKNLLYDQGISVNKIATDLNIHYPTMHSLVNRETLNDTTLESLVRVADYLGVSVKSLYEKTLN